MNKKKKQIRTIIIAVMVITGIISAIAGLKIEPSHSNKDKKNEQVGTFEIHEIQDMDSSGKSQEEDSAIHDSDEVIAENQVSSSPVATTESASDTVLAGQGNEKAGSAEDGTPSIASVQDGESQSTVGVGGNVQENQSVPLNEDIQSEVADSTNQNDTNSQLSQPVTQTVSPEQEKEYITCSIEIRCDELSKKTDAVAEENLKQYIPADGTILKKTAVKLEAGATVYDVLFQVTRNHGIHLDTAYTPMYKNYYIKAIQYLYEGTAGQNSGWRYKVNEVFPNYGCSSYILQEGDTIIWMYSLNVGT